MERLEIEVFLALAEELHFGRAAERIGTSTARVSQLISRLEQTLGVKLFERSSRRVALSPAGVMLKAQLRPAWEQVLAAIEHVAELGKGIEGALIVSSPTDEASMQLEIRAKEFLVQYPECEIHVRKARTSDVRPWLTPGTVDMALIRLPNAYDGLATSAPVLRERRVVAVSRKHELSTREAVSRRDLRSLDIVPLENGSHERIGSGVAVALVGEWARQLREIPDLVTVPVRDADPLQWGFVWPNDAHNQLRDAFVGYCERQR